MTVAMSAQFALLPRRASRRSVGLHLWYKSDCGAEGAAETGSHTVAAIERVVRSEALHNLSVIEPDFKVEELWRPNDPYLGSQRCLDTMKLPDAWDLDAGGGLRDQPVGGRRCAGPGGPAGRGDVVRVQL